jgi:hypothetical protein
MASSAAADELRLMAMGDLVTTGEVPPKTALRQLLAAIEGGRKHGSLRAVAVLDHLCSSLLPPPTQAAILSILARPRWIKR